MSYTADAVDEQKGGTEELTNINGFAEKLTWVLYIEISLWAFIMDVTTEKDIKLEVEVANDS